MIAKNISEIIHFLFPVSVVIVMSLLFVSCSSEMVRTRNAQDNLLTDNYWIGPEKLQIIVTGESTIRNVPFTEQRKESCKNAEKLIDKRLQSLYPKVVNESYRKKIVKSLFFDFDRCKLIVHISGASLQRKIQ